MKLFIGFKRGFRFAGSQPRWEKPACRRECRIDRRKGWETLDSEFCLRTLYCISVAGLSGAWCASILTAAG